MYGPRKRVGSSVDHTWVCSELDAGGNGGDMGAQGIPKRGSCLCNSGLSLQTVRHTGLWISFL